MKRAPDLQLDHIMRKPVYTMCKQQSRRSGSLISIFAVHCQYNTCFIRMSKALASSQIAVLPGRKPTKTGFFVTWLNILNIRSNEREKSKTKYIRQYSSIFTTPGCVATRSHNAPQHNVEAPNSTVVNRWRSPH